MRSIQWRMGVRISERGRVERGWLGGVRVAIAGLGVREGRFYEASTGCVDPSTRPYREDLLANQVVGDIGLRRDDRVAIEFIQQGIHNPVE